MERSPLCLPPTMRTFGVLLTILIAPVFAESYVPRSRKQLLKKLDQAELAGRPVLFAVGDFA